MYQNHRDHISQRCEQRGLLLPAAALDRLARYVEILLQGRSSLNLTGFREAGPLIEVLIVESLDFWQRHLLPPAARVLDLGTGAGIPGIPLAICAPDLQITLLDRTEKKVMFLRRAVSQLRLQGCHPYCGSAEELARRLSPQQRFDVVVARGVGHVAHLLALVAPLLQPGGRLLLRKPLATPELQEAALLLASGVWGEVERLPLPGAGKIRWGLYIITRGGV